jgi:hypothetical protein
MNTFNKLALTVATTAALGAAATSSAYAGSSIQGPQLTGIRLPSIEANQPAVTAVTLPSGAMIAPRPRVTD